jgi:LysM repeat protein
VQRSRRMKQRRRILVGGAILALAVGAGGWRYYRGGWFGRAAPTIAEVSPADANLAAMRENTAPAIVTLPEGSFTRPPGMKREDTSPASAVADEVLRPLGASLPESTPGEQTPPASTRPTVTEPKPEPLDPAPGGNVAIVDARKQMAAGKTLEARQALNALLGQPLSRSNQAEVRKLLTGIADDTIFSKRRLPNDPLTDLYAVQSGDVLVRIGRDYKVPPEVLMRINGIKNAASLRADEKIKVVKGPFNAKIYKSEFRLDVYLQDLYVRSFRVGLGAEQATPEGVWRVKERLENPTYYPSASAERKEIIPADDPNNPLGERWIGLEGIEGDARGRYGYGIHGTIEPESIGKAVSLGCVRMLNDDVALLYGMLLPGQSTVTVLP